MLDEVPDGFLRRKANPPPLLLGRFVAVDEHALHSGLAQALPDGLRAVDRDCDVRRADKLVLQERKAYLPVLREDDSGERVSRGAQPTAERVGYHRHMVAARIDVGKDEEDASAQRRGVARKDDRPDARTRAHVPFARKLLHDAARYAERQTARLRQFLDRRDRITRLEPPVGDFVLYEAAERIRKRSRPVGRVVEVLKKVAVHLDYSGFLSRKDHKGRKACFEL